MEDVEHQPAAAEAIVAETVADVVDEIVQQQEQQEGDKVEAPAAAEAASPQPPAETTTTPAVVPSSSTSPELPAPSPAPPTTATSSSSFSTPALLSSVLPPGTLQRLAWYFGLAAPSTTNNTNTNSALDEYFHSLPALNEAEVLVSFSKTTRQLAGDYSEELNEAADSKRMRQLMEFTQQHQQQQHYAHYQQLQQQQQQQQHRLAASSSSSSHHHHQQNSASAAAAAAAAARKRKRNAVVEDGKHVAAKVDGGQEWNLMTVLRYVKKSRMYILEDADEQVEKKDEVEVSKDLVLPLSCPEYSFGPFPAGARVLAMYPGTTSFYFAKVIKCTKRLAAKRGSGSTGGSNTAALQLAPAVVMYDYQVQYDEDEVGADGELVVHAIKGEFVAEAPDA